jgi:hypothetical protein
MIPCLAVSLFDVAPGVTTTVGKPLSAATLAWNAPGGVVTPPDWGESGAFAGPLAADAFASGTFPVPGDPSPGKTVPS